MTEIYASPMSTKYNTPRNSLKKNNKEDYDLLKVPDSALILDLKTKLTDNHKQLSKVIVYAQELEQDIAKLQGQLKVKEKEEFSVKDSVTYKELAAQYTQLNKKFSNLARRY